MMHNYFTITAGRTGSAWLASLLSQNLNINEVHEYLGINDFGDKMPDIRTMRNFNNFGNNDFVQNFWKRKFEYIPNELYAETNHTLCKCGLIENIFLNKREKYTTLIILKRNMTDQCVSYIERNDFGNITKENLISNKDSTTSILVRIIKKGWPLKETTLSELRVIN